MNSHHQLKDNPSHKEHFVRFFKRNTGFTLIELLLVIVIMSTLSVMTVGFYSRFLRQNEVLNVTDQISGQIRKAQIYAMMGKQSGSNWGINYSTNTITLYRGNSFATRIAAHDERFTVNPNVSITGLTDLNFAHATGLPSLAPTINITSGTNAKTVIVNSQGVVSK